MQGQTRCLTLVPGALAWRGGQPVYQYCWLSINERRGIDTHVPCTEVCSSCTAACCHKAAAAKRLELLLPHGILPQEMPEAPCMRGSAVHALISLILSIVLSVHRRCGQVLLRHSRLGQVPAVATAAQRPARMQQAAAVPGAGPSQRGGVAGVDQRSGHRLWQPLRVLHPAAGLSGGLGQGEVQGQEGAAAPTLEVQGKAVRRQGACWAATADGRPALACALRWASAAELPGAGCDSPTPAAAQRLPPDRLLHLRACAQELSGQKWCTAGGRAGWAAHVKMGWLNLSRLM